MVHFLVTKWWFTRLTAQNLEKSRENVCEIFTNDMYVFQVYTGFQQLSSQFVTPIFGMCAETF